MLCPKLTNLQQWTHSDEREIHKMTGKNFRITLCKKFSEVRNGDFKTLILATGESKTGMITV
jgi:hypothetical protein